MQARMKDKEVCHMLKSLNTKNIISIQIFLKYSIFIFLYLYFSKDYYNPLYRKKTRKLEKTLIILNKKKVNQKNYPLRIGKKLEKNHKVKTKKTQNKKIKIEKYLFF